VTGDNDRVYTAAMSARLADVTGTVATVVAGVLLAALSLSAFGAVPTLLAFLALFLLATTTHRAISRHR
jgi:1,4-dihydroxy-2-naphthoate octaprenyltransferase